MWAFWITQFVTLYFLLRLLHGNFGPKEKLGLTTSN